MPYYDDGPYAYFHDYSAVHDGSITTAKLANGSVTSEKLAPSLQERIFMPISNAKKNVAFIGDSWTVGANGTATSYGYADVISDLGVFSIVDKYAQGGAGFAAVANNKTFVTLANELVASGVQYDTIFIVGGINDNESAPFTNCLTNIQTIIDTLRDNTDADIYYVPNVQQGYPVGSRRRQNAFAQKFAMNCVPVFSEVAALQGYLHEKYWTSDNYHLTIAGYRIYAQAIVSAYAGGDMNFYVESESHDLTDLTKIFGTITDGVTINKVNVYHVGTKKFVLIQFALSTTSAANVAGQWNTLFSVKPLYYVPVFYNSMYDGQFSSPASFNGITRFATYKYTAANQIQMYLNNRITGDTTDTIVFNIDCETGMPFNGFGNIYMYTDLGNFDYSS